MLQFIPQGAIRENLIKGFIVNKDDLFRYVPIQSSIFFFQPPLTPLLIWGGETAAGSGVVEYGDLVWKEVVDLTLNPECETMIVRKKDVTFM